ncbi:dual OB domain-containing protein [Formosa sp. 4Alg 33]|uniref:dual OB domain-containing protein n=1 Tax=Formosa sp. 4Alg 33 TaxID=3382189 RepID=UPI003D9C303B
MEVLITSKTKFGKNHVCVGGLVVKENRFIRLLNRGGARNPSGWYQFADTPLNIGDIWDIDFNDSPNAVEPHLEDVFIKINKKVSEVSDIADFIKKSGVTIWEGNITNTFESKLEWLGNGSGYLPETIKEMPVQSVGFWISDIDITLSDSRYFYKYKLMGLITISKSLKWVGMEKPIETIPKGTLIRVSLAKWWPPKDKLDDYAVPHGCYLQLSGWY